MGKSKGTRATEVASEQSMDNEAMDVLAFLFFPPVKMNALLSAAKCMHIPPYLKSAMRLYATIVSHFVDMRSCQEGERRAKRSQ